MRFNPADPTSVDTVAPVHGLRPGERVLGFDFRPATGVLFGVTNQARVVAIDTTTGAASQGVALVDDATSAPVALQGAVVGVDFNPVVDRLRVVTDAGQNLRINPTTGATIVDAALNEAGAPEAGVFAAAYATTCPGRGPRRCRTSTTTPTATASSCSRRRTRGRSRPSARSAWT